MQDFRKRRNIRAEILRATLATLGIAALVCVSYFAVRGAWGMYQKFAMASEASAQAQTRLAALEQRHAEVLAGVEELKSDRGIEAELRGRYGVARPGEGEITVVRQAATTSTGQGEPAGWWGKLWHALFVW